MKHKTLLVYVPCLEGGCEDAGRVDLAGYTLISDKHLYDLEAAEQDAIEQARLNGMGASREAALMAKLEAAEKERDALRAKIAEMEQQEPVMWANSSTINSSRINKERGGHGDQHTCSETQTTYHDTQLYALPGAKGE